MWSKKEARIANMVLERNKGEGREIHPSVLAAIMKFEWESVI